jgi:phosphomannomutase/phosphoglucomutase
MVPLASVAVAFVLAAVVSLFLLQPTINSHHSERLAGRAADSLEFQVNQRQDLLLSQIQSAARSLLLSELMITRDPSLISLEEGRLRELIPNAIRVRLFPLGTAKIDRSANPPFSFTSLDMVNKVETGFSIDPEAINHGGSWVLSIAAPVIAPSDETIRGTLFVYLEMSALSSGLDQILDGEVRLEQQFGNNDPSVILKMGSTFAGAPEVSRLLRNKTWQLKYYPSDRIANAAVGGIVEFLLPLVAFLLIATGGVAFGIKRVLGTINADARKLSNQMADAVSGDYEHSLDYSFTAFADLDINLGRLGRRTEDKPEVEKLNVTLQPKEKTIDEMVDIEMIDEDDFEAEMDKQAPPEPEPEPEDTSALAEIFRAYDIRGVVNETLTPEVIKRIGLAIGTEAGELGEQTLIVGCDGRISSPAVVDMLIEGITESGRDVINIGMVPTPVVYFATYNSETQSGVVVTASHNPPEYNGFKIMLAGRTLVEEDMEKLYQRVISNDFSSGDGDITEIDILDDYMDAITDDVVVAQSLKVVVDCGNGVAGKVAPELFSNLGCDVVDLYCDVDGDFPNHPPDPLRPENLNDLKMMVTAEGADLGIALDGDGDRLVAVTASGEIVWPDRLLMLFAKDVVSRNPGSDVVYDVKCSRHLNSIISSFGGRPVICRSGHSYVKEKIAETDAVLGGEMSGHICFGERWFGFDDGLYSAARLLEIVGSQSEGLEDLLEEFPASLATPEIIIEVGEQRKFDIVDIFIEMADFPEGTATTVDGIRVDFSDGWGLVRASNTGPNLTLRFEADDQAALVRIQEAFKSQLQVIEEGLDF